LNGAVSKTVDGWFCGAILGPSQVLPEAALAGIRALPLRCPLSGALLAQAISREAGESDGRKTDYASDVRAENTSTALHIP
jgi:hypothetical protein